MLGLCMVYDQHPKSLNPVNLLDTIKANIEIFDERSFRQRLMMNPVVDWWPRQTAFRASVSVTRILPTQAQRTHS